MIKYDKRNLYSPYSFRTFNVLVSKTSDWFTQNLNTSGLERVRLNQFFFFKLKNVMLNQFFNLKI